MAPENIERAAVSLDNAERTGADFGTFGAVDLSFE
jgi:hypothetical protein